MTSQKLAHETDPRELLRFAPESAKDKKSREATERTRQAPTFAVHLDEDCSDHAPQIPTTSAIIFDPMNLAAQVESCIKDFVHEYPKGFWMPGQSNPAIIPGHTYYLLDPRTRVSQAVSFTTMEEIVAGSRHDILNDHADVVVPGPLVHRHLREAPHIPIRGLALVDAAVKDIVESSSQWIKHRDRRQLERVLLLMLKDEYLSDTDFVEKLQGQISSIVTELEEEVRNFIGADDWVMHFLSIQNRDRILKKTIDYRIYDWEMRMSNGEWRR